MKHIFSLGKIPDYLNKTLITLIPKCSNPESIGNYRPISLCNSIYKVVTKIIMACLRPKLPDLVSPLQTTFVSGRNGVDNAIIVQELIHSMSKKKGGNGVMAIKIDIEKAYDRLEWSFIRDTLKLFKLPDSLISLIMSCVSNLYHICSIQWRCIGTISTYKRYSTGRPFLSISFYSLHGSPWSYD